VNCIHIVAAAENGAIGKDNRLLWRLPTDMKFFREKTTSHCVLTGRKNYESIPPQFRPLPDRTNIVVTREENYVAAGAIVVSTIEKGIEYAKQAGETDLYIIGGGEIYAQTQALINRIYLTRVHASFEADTFYPSPNPTIWQEVWREEHLQNEKHAHAFTFLCYEKI
jgi:dihydrofolate reductase